MLNFTVTDEQQRKIKEWDKCKNNYHGAIGGHLLYVFIPTSIGTLLSVSCEDCGEKLEFYDDME